LKNIYYYLHGAILSAFASMAAYVTFQDASIYSPPDAIWRATVFSIAVYAFLALILYALTRDHETTSLVATILVLGLMYIWRTFLIVAFSAGLAWLALAFVVKNFKLSQLHVSIAVISVAISAYSGIQYINLATKAPWDSKTNLTAPVDLVPAAQPES